MAKQRPSAKATKKSTSKKPSTSPRAAGAKPRPKAVAEVKPRVAVAAKRPEPAKRSEPPKTTKARSSAPPATNGVAHLDRDAGRNGTSPGRFTEMGERMRKTNLAPAELKEFKELLSAKRSELIGDMNHLRNEALGHGSSGEGGGNSSMPIHMADIGSDTWEQELTLGLIEKERGLLREIEEALDRIEDRTYGICIATNKPISKARLRAKPWAKYCIEHARKRELGLG